MYFNMLLGVWGNSFYVQMKFEKSLLEAHSALWHIKVSADLSKKTLLSGLGVGVGG